MPCPVSKWPKLHNCMFRICRIFRNRGRLREKSGLMARFRCLKFSPNLPYHGDNNSVNRESGFRLFLETGSWQLVTFFLAAARLLSLLSTFYFALFTAFRGSTLPYSRRAMPIAPQQRHPPSLSPRLRQYGGASLTSRRFLWRKIRSAAALPVLPAVNCGGSSASPANKKGQVFAPALS